MSEQKWFYASNGQQVGPISWDDLMSGLKDGAFTKETPVRAERVSEWTSLGKCMSSVEPGIPSASMLPSKQSSSSAFSVEVLPRSSAIAPIPKQKKRSKTVVLVLSGVLLALGAFVMVPAFLAQRERAKLGRQSGPVSNTPAPATTPGPASGAPEQDLKATAKLPVNLVEFCRVYNDALNQQVEKYKSIYSAHLSPQSDQSALSVLPGLIGSALNPYNAVDAEGYMTLFPGDVNHLRVMVKLIDQKIDQVVFDCGDEMVRPGGAPNKADQLIVFSNALFGEAGGPAYTVMHWLPTWETTDETTRGYVLQNEAIVSGKIPYKGGNSCLYKGVLITGRFIDPAKPKGQRGIRYVFQFAI